MTTIEVTPAGEQLYQVEVEDHTGASRHEVGLPDQLLSRLDLEGLAAKDAVTAAVELLMDRVGRDGLDRQVDLGDAAERYPDLLEQIPVRARERQEAEPPTFDTDPADQQRHSRDRLLAEVEQEQQAGSVSAQDPHR